MSSFKHPVGSRPSRVYWRRRATVIGALLLVIIVIALFAAHAGSGSGAVPVASSTPSSASTPVPSPTVAAPVAGASAAATPSPTSTPAAGAGTTANGTCTASDITLKPIADQSSYSSLEQPKISMSITNSSTSACSIDLGSAEQVLTISSGAETYWSSKDCQVGGTHQIVKLTAGQTLATPAITWDRTRSSTSTCSTTRSSVPGGGASYHLSVAVGSIKSTTTALMILN